MRAVKSKAAASTPAPPFNNCPHQEKEAPRFSPNVKSSRSKVPTWSTMPLMAERHLSHAEGTHPRVRGCPKRPKLPVGTKKSTVKNRSSAFSPHTARVISMNDLENGQETPVSFSGHLLFSRGGYSYWEVTGHDHGSGGTDRCRWFEDSRR